MSKDPKAKLIEDAVKAYEAGKPIMTDAQYDALTEEGPLGTKGKFKHEVPMLSQGKVHSYDEVSHFLKKTNDESYSVSLKVDGFACSVHYVYGHLVSASTRGNGTYGEDITEAFKMHVCNYHETIETLKSIPDVTIRGEIHLPKTEYKKLNTTTSSRNIATGMCKRNIENLEVGPKLEFRAWDVITPEFKTEYEKLIWLSNHNLDVTPNTVCDASNVLQAVKALEDQKELYNMYCDGIVVKCNSVELQQSLKGTKHHPNYSVAYKFKVGSVQTQVTSITFTEGKTGRITPIVNLVPVMLDGAVISKASVGSKNMLEKLGISEGCTVEIERTGGVIPHIIKVIK